MKPNESFVGSNICVLLCVYSLKFQFDDLDNQPNVVALKWSSSSGCLQSQIDFVPQRRGRMLMLFSASIMNMKKAEEGRV